MCTFEICDIIRFKDDEPSRFSPTKVGQLYEIVKLWGFDTEWGVYEIKNLKTGEEEYISSSRTDFDLDVVYLRKKKLETIVNKFNE